MNEDQGQLILHKLQQIEERLVRIDGRVAWLEELANAWIEDEADRRERERKVLGEIDAKFNKVALRRWRF